MRYRKLANTDLQLSEVTFGAWAAGGWMWGGTERSDAIEAIRGSFELGVTSIDTAPIYGQGESEEIVGEAIKDLPRDQIQILTKYGMRWDLNKGEFGFSSKDNAGNDIDIYKYAGKESVIKECEDSLKRLGTDYIDLYRRPFLKPWKRSPGSSNKEKFGMQVYATTMPHRWQKQRNT
jgi:aryl-alcohol dehydrogenase-like predicted oxidoreductase